MIELLNSEQVIENIDVLKKLLKYCHENGTRLDLSDEFYEQKIKGLSKYLDEGKAFYFVVKEDEEIVGFLWAYEIEKECKRIMHIAYFAVLEQCQKKGYGALLMNALEVLASNMGIEKLELNVRASNKNAIKFYRKKNFCDEKIAMIKDLTN